MTHPAGESKDGVLRLDFDRRVKLEFHGSKVTSDAGLLPYRELDEALGLMAIAEARLADGRSGKNGRHALVGMLRQSVFGRLAGYYDVNDGERLGFDPAMRWIVGGKAVSGRAASASHGGRFETSGPCGGGGAALPRGEWLTEQENLAILADLPEQCIDRVHSRRPPKGIVLDMDSSVSPTHGDQEGTPTTGTCYHPLFLFNQFGDLERCALQSGHMTAPFPTGHRQRMHLARRAVPHMDQGRQERHQMDAAILSFLHRQCRATSAPRSPTI